LIKPELYAETTAGIPMVEFVDVDSDGMIDMLFYHGTKVYTYYNMHEHQPFGGGYSESPYLCKRWDQTEQGLIFQSYIDLKPEEVKDGGNQFVVI
jgi:hypothetical protein